MKLLYQHRNYLSVFFFIGFLFSCYLKLAMVSTPSKGQGLLRTKQNGHFEYFQNANVSFIFVVFLSSPLNRVFESSYEMFCHFSISFFISHQFMFIDFLRFTNLLKCNLNKLSTFLRGIILTIHEALYCKLTSHCFESITTYMLVFHQPPFCTCFLNNEDFSVENVLLNTDNSPVTQSQ